jgi:hypothetical protein
MCGISGFINTGRNPVWFADNIIPEALQVGQLRGRDATGFFSQPLHERKTLHRLRCTGPADEFLNWDEVHKVLKRAEHMRFLVAHNRAATIGNKDDVKAAHPHHTENITLVHNGTLTSYDKSYISDSAWVAAMLEEEPDFREVEKEVYGPYVFVWHDKRDDTLNFVRNEGRPLFFLEGVDNSLWFASEELMMRWIMTRRNKQVRAVHELKPAEWVQFTPEGKVRTLTIPTYYKKRTVASIERESTVEGYLKTAEARRALSTTKHGKKQITTFEKMDVEKSTEEPARPLVLAGGSGVVVPRHGAWTPPPSPPKEQPSVLTRPRCEDGEPAKGGGNPIQGPHSIFLEEWCGLTPRDSVFFFPTQFYQATNNKATTCVAGPLFLFKKDQGVELVKGVTCRGGLLRKIDEEWTPQEGKLEALRKQQFAYEAQITKLVYDRRTQRLTMWVRDAEPQDWADLDGLKITMDEVYAADRAPMNPASLTAPEVAETEKKSGSTASAC